MGEVLIKPPTEAPDLGEVQRAFVVLKARLWRDGEGQARLGK